MRRIRALTTAVIASLLALGVTTTPAYAGKTATATISSDARCKSDQETTAVQVRLSQIPKWQKITVSTTAYPVTRDHDEWTREGDSSVGTGFYNIPVEGDVRSVTAWISDNAWDGSFRVTGTSCRNVAPSTPTTTAPTTEPTTQQPSTGNPPPAVTTAPTTTSPTNTAFPGIPASTVTPGSTTVSGIPTGTSLPPSAIPSASASPSISGSAAPSASQESAISSSATATTAANDDFSLFGDDDDKDIATSVMQVVSSPVENAEVIWPWLLALLVLFAAIFWVRSYTRARSKR